jgi:hypothetical protein
LEKPCSLQTIALLGTQNLWQRVSSIITRSKIMEKKIIGLKKLTKPNSIPVRMAAGGKELVRDNSKQRKYRVAGEKPLAQ